MEIIHQLAALRELRGRAAGYTSINIQTNSLLHAHRDRNNFGSSWLLACGSFTGGQLWVEAIGDELQKRVDELVPLPT
eukprot:4312358-Amphidinium_carterae.1